MKKNYFYVHVHYNGENHISEVRFRPNGEKYVRKRLISGSTHLIRARSKEESIEIAKRHGMAYPRHSKNVIGYRSTRLDLRKSYCKKSIRNRKRGIGGNIWYEDKNGKLQIETNETNKTEKKS